MTSVTAGLWPDVHDERSALLELLEALEPEQWDHPTLCSQWRVRDVVAHIVRTTEIKLPSALWAIARSRFNMNRYIDRDARRLGKDPIPKLLADYRAALPTTTHPPGQSPLAILEDIVIHQIDIRLPLGQPRTVSHERMKLVADYLDGNGFYPGKKLARGLFLQATDTNWTTGDGPTVSGPLLALVLTLSGRFVMLDELEGDGATSLRNRIQVST